MLVCRNSFSLVVSKVDAEYPQRIVRIRSVQLFHKEGSQVSSGVLLCVVCMTMWQTCGKQLSACYFQAE